MKATWMLVYVFAGVALLTACVGRAAWADEGYRIDKSMQREHFCEHSEGAKGISVDQAPPIADPPKPSETFRLQDRRRSLGRVSRTPRNSSSTSMVLR